MPVPHNHTEVNVGQFNNWVAAGNPDVVSVWRKKIIEQRSSGQVRVMAQWMEVLATESNNVSTSPGTYLVEAENWVPQIVSWPQCACCDTHVSVHACTRTYTHTHINKYDPLSCLRSKKAKKRTNSCAKKIMATCCRFSTQTVPWVCLRISYWDVLDSESSRSLCPRDIPEESAFSVFIFYKLHYSVCIAIHSKEIKDWSKKPGKPQTSTWLRPACVAGSPPPKPV